MPLDLSTPTTVAARLTITHCERLPAGEQYVAVPRPEAGRFVCPHPCGGACRLVQPARFKAAPLRRHACHLGLFETLQQLTMAALQPPAPLAFDVTCDVQEEAPRPACGALHLN